jgi:hypothetical protein
MIVSCKPRLCFTFGIPKIHPLFKCQVFVSARAPRGNGPGVPDDRSVSEATVSELEASLARMLQVCSDLVFDCSFYSRACSPIERGWHGALARLGFGVPGVTSGACTAL